MKDVELSKDQRGGSVYMPWHHRHCPYDHKFMTSVCSSFLLPSKSSNENIIRRMSRSLGRSTISKSKLVPPTKAFVLAIICEKGYK
uniref:Uncharacterized protein n=1 Tax=Glossina pallidipes TaxID=7398 RepID=A0A1B0AJR4_GLOPL